MNSVEVKKMGNVEKYIFKEIKKCKKSFRKKLRVGQTFSKYEKKLDMSQVFSKYSIPGKNNSIMVLSIICFDVIKRYIAICLLVY